MGQEYPHRPDKLMGERDIKWSLRKIYNYKQKYI